MTSVEKLAVEYKQALDRLESRRGQSGEMAAIGHADVTRRYARLSLAKAVRQARANGRTWDEIAMVLGTSKQAVRERFGSP
jgi:predicted transcriptional regulator